MIRKNQYLLATALFCCMGGAMAADCLKENVLKHEIAVENLYELCFFKEITQVKFSNATNFKRTVEVEEDIPTNYRENGVKGVLSIIASTPGKYTNAIVDTSDGIRREYTFVSVNNNAN